MNVTSLLDRSILSQFRDGERNLAERLDRIIVLLEELVAATSAPAQETLDAAMPHAVETAG